MYIITDAYLTQFEIPNIDEADSKVYSRIERIIDSKCRLFMLEALGQEKYAEMDSYLVDGLLPEVPTFPTVDPVPVKWRNLITGCSYVKDDVTYKWKGLYFTEGTAKGSILANYAYYYFLEGEASTMLGVGDAKANPKGAVQVNPFQRMCRVWNEMVKMNQQDLRGNLPYFDGYDYFFNYDWCLGYENAEVSLLQFLNDNEADYPNTNRKYYRIQNQLGL